jgi:hypothetical protein
VVTYPFLHSNPTLSQVPGLTVWGSSARFVSTGINPWQARTLQISNEKKVMQREMGVDRNPGWIPRCHGSGCCNTENPPEVAFTVEPKHFCVHCFECISSSSIRVKKKFSMQLSE